MAPAATTKLLLSDFSSAVLTDGFPRTAALNDYASSKGSSSSVVFFSF